MFAALVDIPRMNDASRRPTVARSRCNGFVPCASADGVSCAAAAVSQDSRTTSMLALDEIRAVG